jgi:transforming growth factor-beta-induced protein
MKRTFLKIIAAAGVAALVSACGGSDHDDEPTSNIAELATSAGLSSLVAAADKAGLVGALSDASARLTVFAPTNAAFDTLATQLGFANGPAMVTALPANALASILTYHVLPTRLNASQLSSGGATQPTLYGFGGSPATVAIAASGGTVRVGDAVLTQATVTAANQGATNGIVHVVDKVLVPPGVLNVVQMAQANPAAFSSLVGAVADANLAATLSGAGPFTVFAPTNAAFANAPSGLTIPQLTTVLTYHVLADEVLSSELGPVFGAPVATVSGQSITILNNATAPAIATIDDTTTTNANITAVDVRASNGVIHVIDKVLIPTL